MTASDQPADMDNRSGQDFEEHRAVLFYPSPHSMLGSAAEAEDIVQETWLRRQRVREPVRQERALLCRIATRLALNAMALRGQPEGVLPGAVASRAGRH